jgi:CRP-like cAMP-binding protein
MSNDDMPTEVPSDVFEFLRSHNTLTLATASLSGLPHAATMVYVSEGIVLYFATRPDTTTARHVEQNPTISFTIDEYTTDWNRAKGIQGSGEAQVLLSSAEISRVVGLFQQKFPAIGDARTSNVSLFRISPSSLQFINNEKTDNVAVGTSLGTSWHRSVAYNVFHDLPQQDVEEVAAKLDAVQVDAGEVIVRQGAPADKFFIITDGEVEVIHEANGETRTVAHLQRGQFFGEMAILRDTPRNATVKAVTKTTLLAMDRDAFRGLVAQSLGTTQNFDQVIQRRLDELSAARTGA